MQSALVLNGTYCDLVRRQLAAQEKKKNRKKKEHLVGDGLPCLLTSWKFVQRVIEFEESAKAKETTLEQRKVTRLEKAEALKKWKALDDQRKEQNKEIRSDWAERVKDWEAERDLAKQERRRPGWKKPVLKGLLFSALPKPGYAVEAGEKTVEDDDKEDDSGSESSDSGKSSSSDTNRES
ncbi:hypothetical protein B0H10DRAFT_1808510 [Mycena sp. CBHHK59/15]|nr:hypothetical protein B0H10DRAFT_1808510 [Mycena sp. CBHHK59/15]